MNLFLTVASCVQMTIAGSVDLSDSSPNSGTIEQTNETLSIITSISTDVGRMRQ